MISFKKGRPENGATLIDYAIATSVLVVAIAGIAMVMAPELADMVRDNTEKPYGQPLNTPTTAVTSVPTTPPTTTSTPAVYSVLNITLASGEVLSIDDYPTDLTASIEANAGNGTSSKIAAFLEQLAHDLLMAEEIDDDEYDLLIALAEAGHAEAETQRQLEEAVNDPNFSAAGDDNTLNTVATNYYNMMGYGCCNTNSPNLTRDSDAGMLVNFSGRSDFDSDIAADLLDPASAASGGTFKQMLEAYQRVKNESYLLDNPIIAEIVNSSVLDIAAISEQMSMYLSTAQTNTYSGSDIGTIGSDGEIVTVPVLADELRSGISHARSGNICDSGGGDDTGFSCS